MERTYLKKAREKLGLTQSDVAKKVGISANYYCDIENGNRQQEMKATLLAQLSDVLKIPLYLMICLENCIQDQETEMLILDKNVDGLRERAQSLTRVMEREKFTYRDAHLFVEILKDEIEQCVNQEEERLLKARY